MIQPQRPGGIRRTPPGTAGSLRLDVQRAPRRDPGGAISLSSSVAVLLAGARPDEAERFTILDELGVDWSREARIVELDREIVAALVGALRPGGADLGAADIYPMARCIVARPVCFENNAHASAVQAEGEDLALEIVAGLLEGADICHVKSPWLYEPATIAARWRSAGRR